METFFSIFAILAISIHIYIWILESFLWTKPATIKTFGTTNELANASRGLAFNQGFYNLFLAIVAAVGLVLLLQGHVGSGKALLFAGLGSMVLASLVLILSDRTKLRAALVQFTPPVIALAFLLCL